MSRRKSDHPVVKVTLSLYDGDIDRLRDCHPDIPVSVVVRELIRQHLLRIEEQVAARPRSRIPVEVNFDD